MNRECVRWNTPGPGESAEDPMGYTASEPPWPFRIEVDDYSVIPDDTNQIDCDANLQDVQKMIPTSRQIDELHSNWIWVEGWEDSSLDNTAARLVTFKRSFHLDHVPSSSIIHCTADTRYKLFLNGARVSVGPSRSSPERWLYDTIDIAPFLSRGENVITVVVLRYFYATRAAMAFVRTGYPGFTLIGSAGENDLRSGLCEEWSAKVDSATTFPMGLEDDVFLHINERSSSPSISPAVIRPFILRLTNGEIAPWRLYPREIPLPEQNPVAVSQVHATKSCRASETWQHALSSNTPITLPGNTAHKIDILADCHSTAFTKWTFHSSSPTNVRLKVTYSEAYELEPRRYPWLRTKHNRLDSVNGKILGPYDEVILRVNGTSTYEPFWFRTFRILRVDIACGPVDVDLVSLETTQANYPLNVKAKWEDGDGYSQRIMDISIRTMRNCMFDAYSDCPFYEQLSYSGDSRSVSLFHYLLSGDDRLARQTISSFAGSVTPLGLTQSRYPSQVQQVIAGFSLYWILQVYDHLLYFGDIPYARSFLPIADGILEFFDRHIDHLGLVSGLPEEVWQYVDWVTGWHETQEHPDKGVPTAGRESNRHTYFSMLYAWVLQHAARLVRQVGRPQYAAEYESRAEKVITAIVKHCYDERLGLFTDSTSDVPPNTPAPMSQHVQVFAVLCGAVNGLDAADLLRRSFAKNTTLGKCSYVMMFYAFRAFAAAGIYDEMYHASWEPWRRMIDQNLSTWEEDDVRQRSDCHAWGSVPVYEYLMEVAGIEPFEPGCKAIVFSPRVLLSQKLNATIALGRENVAKVSWDRSGGTLSLELDHAVRVVSRMDGSEIDHGCVSRVELAL